MEPAFKIENIKFNLNAKLLAETVPLSSIPKMIRNGGYINYSAIFSKESSPVLKGNFELLLQNTQTEEKKSINLDLTEIVTELKDDRVVKLTANQIIQNF